MLLGVLLSVAFFTLVERKVLGYVHFRKGPGKVLIHGLSQPFSDAIKLFTKELFFVGGGAGFYFLYPFIGLMLMFLLWGIFGNVWRSDFSFVMVFCLISLGVYFVLLCGWGGGSKYSFWGGYRGVAQVLSYEVAMVVFALVVGYLFSSYGIFYYCFFQGGLWFFFFSFHLFYSWVVVCMAETSRPPFDFSEGESELVSGFNVEFAAAPFSVIFICEYGMVLFFSLLSVVFFFGYGILKSFIVSLIFLWVRGSLPRTRYDLLMVFSWKSLLPLSLLFLSFSTFLS